MKFETLEQALAAFEKHLSVMAAYNHALGVLYHDGSTAAPKESWQGRSRTMGVMSEITYELETKPEIGEMLNFLENHAEELSPLQRREVEVLRKGYDQMHKIPAEEYVAYSMLVNESETVWEKAKNTNDFALFAPYLEKIVEYNRKFAGKEICRGLYPRYLFGRRHRVQVGEAGLFGLSGQFLFLASSQ